jgi:hypothetical protein
MQLISVYLYPNKLDVFTNYLADWTTERYRQVYQRNLKIYRGVDNRIDIQVKNADQKPQAIADGSFVFNLVSRETQELILSKTCSVRNLSIGRIYVELTADEVKDIEAGFYQFSIIKEDRGDDDDDSIDYVVNSRTPMYLNSQYETIGTIEVSGNLYGEPQASVVVKEFSENVPEVFTDPNDFTSSIIDAHPETSIGSSTHTFQFYLSDYSGQIKIQGSLSDGATPHVWSDIQTYNVTDSDLKYANIIGKYNYFRIRHTPLGSSNTASFVVTQTMLLNYNVGIYVAGAGYRVGETITIAGNRLGGELITNDLTITVTNISARGNVTEISWTGLSYNGVRSFVLSGDSTSIGTIDKILYR